MRAQTLLDKPTPTPLRPQWQALEPLDVLVVEKHVAHGDNALVDLVGVAGEDDAFGDDAVEGRRERGARCDEAEGGGGRGGGWLDVGVGVGGWRGSCALEVEERNVAPG